MTAALGVAQLERLDALLAERARVAGLYRERLSAIEGLVLPCEDEGAERRSWFVYVVQLPEDVDRDGLIGRLAEQGIASKAYLPVIHLQPYYRERFGYRGGEFPVAEAVAARSLALPFFTTMGESEVERVASARCSPRAWRPRCTLHATVSTSQRARALSASPGWSPPLPSR